MPYSLWIQPRSGRPELRTSAKSAVRPPFLLLVSAGWSFVWSTLDRKWHHPIGSAKGAGVGGARAYGPGRIPGKSLWAAMLAHRLVLVQVLVLVLALVLCKPSSGVQGGGSGGSGGSGEGTEDSEGVAPREDFQSRLILTLLERKRWRSVQGTGALQISEWKDGGQIGAVASAQTGSAAGGGTDANLHQQSNSSDETTRENPEEDKEGSGESQGGKERGDERPEETQGDMDSAQGRGTEDVDEPPDETIIQEAEIDRIGEVEDTVAVHSSQASKMRLREDGRQRSPSGAAAPPLKREIKGAGSKMPGLRDEGFNDTAEIEPADKDDLRFGLRDAAAGVSGAESGSQAGQKREQAECGEDLEIDSAETGALEKDAPRSGGKVPRFAHGAGVQLQVEGSGRCAGLSAGIVEAMRGFLALQASSALGYLIYLGMQRRLAATRASYSTTVPSAPPSRPRDAASCRA